MYTQTLKCMAYIYIYVCVTFSLYNRIEMTISSHLNRNDYFSL